MIRVRCPEPDAWQALLEGTEDEADSLAGHLEGCADCRRTLDALAADAADWQEAAQALQERRAGQEPALRHVVERLKGEPAAAAEEAELWFLRPADGPALLGQLGPYEVQEVIGRGGMGTVLKAFDPSLNRVVAIKVMAAALAGSATARLRFQREGRAAAAVCHEHVVAVHGVGELDGLPYLVMQYIAGESLQERLDRTGPLPVEEAVRIGHQTAAGLAAAHAQGLIHRDVTPANLLLENGVARVKITDFGLARMADGAGLTQAGVLAGTPEYMAPEQARGDPVDPRADLFSLGSVLYACCTGKPPFQGSTALAVLRRVNDEEPAPLRTRNPAVPCWLEALVTRLMAKDPAERIQTASEVAALLEGYLAHLQQPASVPAPPLPQSPRSARHPRHLLPLVAVLMLAAGGLLAPRFLGAAGRTPGADGATEPVRRLHGHAGPVHNLQFTADGRLVSGSGWPGGDRSLRVWDPATGRETLHVATPGQVLGLDLAPDGRSALVGLDSGPVLLVNLDDGRVLATLKGHGGPVGWVGFAPDGQHAFSAAHDGTARMWDLSEGREVGQFRAHGKWANCGAVFPDGRRLLTGDDRGLLQIWDVATGQEVGRVDVGSALDVSVLPDGRRALVAGNEASLWDLETGERLRTFQGHNDGVFQASLSPDGRQVLTASFDGRVRLWDFETAELLRVVGSHDEFVFAAVFSPDGRLVASGGGGRHDGEDYLPGTDHDIRIWDLGAGAATAAAAPRPATKGWLAAGLIIGLAVIAAGLVAAWLWSRRTRARKESAPLPQVGPEAAASLVAFACPGCGHSLKVKAELAGKKGKCPGCGQVVLVPGPAGAGRPGDAAS